MIKVSIQKEDIRILKIYIPNYSASKYMKEKVLEPQEEKHNPQM